MYDFSWWLRGVIGTNDFPVSGHSGYIANWYTSVSHGVRLKSAYNILTSSLISKVANAYP